MLCVGDMSRGQGTRWGRGHVWDKKNLFPLISLVNYLKFQNLFQQMFFSKNVEKIPIRLLDYY